MKFQKREVDRLLNFLQTNKSVFSGKYYAQRIPCSSSDCWFVLIIHFWSKTNRNFQIFDTKKGIFCLKMGNRNFDPVFCRILFERSFFEEL